MKATEKGVGVIQFYDAKGNFKGAVGGNAFK
jgi:hypothetical protein